MLNTIRKTLFSDREIINLIRETPLVQNAIQERIDTAEAEEKAERDRAIDALKENGHQQRQIENAIAAQKSVHDAAHAAWQIEADKLGALSTERLHLQRAEVELCGALARNGEGTLDHALMQLWEGVVLYSAQIREIESDLRHARKDRFDGTFPEWRARKVFELDNLKRRLQQNRSAIATATPWSMARVSPREQIARVEKLMASLG